MIKTKSLGAFGAKKPRSSDQVKTYRIIRFQRASKHALVARAETNSNT